MAATREKERDRAWLTYKLGSLLDKPLYDTMFGPGRRRWRLLAHWQRVLRDRRGAVVACMFGRVNSEINTYALALEKGLITEKGDRTLYRPPSGCGRCCRIRWTPA